MIGLSVREAINFSHKLSLRCDNNALLNINSNFVLKKFSFLLENQIYFCFRLT